MKLLRFIVKAVPVTLFFTQTPLFANTGSLIDFSISINTAHDGGLGYTNFTAGEAGSASRYVIGFELTITGIDGEPVTLGPLATFCSEIQEPISASTPYSFHAAPLSQLAAGTASVAGTASSGMPAGGIGTLAASQLAYLFDQHYISSTLSDWTMNDTTPSLHAFQLAVWEITHDTDLNLLNTGGVHYLAPQTDGTNPTRRQNAVTLAQSYLDEVAANIVDNTYVSQKFDILSLVSSSGNGSGGWQDIVLAFDKASPEAEIFNDVAVVPEASAASLLLGLAAALWMVRRRS